MIVRSYSGRTVAEAIDKVRGDLGTDALIIETRTVRESGVFGRRCGYEVVAASDTAAASSRQTNRSDQLNSWRRRLDQHLDGSAARGQAAALDRRSTTALTDSNDSQLSAELSAIRDQLARLASGTAKADSGSLLDPALRQHLSDCE
ncbi:MAG: hypothetical protein ACYTF0_04965, partial [Planctomycetota bacterium]